MIERAIDYPRAGDDALTTILIGGVLGLLGFLVVPGLLLLGYFVRVLRSVEAGQETPPTFGQWGELLVDGVRAFVVVFVYSLVPTVVFAVTVGGSLAGAMATGDVRPGALAGALFGLVIGGVLWLVAFYVVPAALASLASEDRLAAAFSWGTLSAVLFDRRYAVGWLLALVLVVVGVVLVGVLNVVPLLGFVVGAFVNFYVAVAAFYLYGHAFADVAAADVLPESSSQPAV